MQHYWPGRRLAELHCNPPTMSLLEFRRFVRFLPRDSNTIREMHPPDALEEWWTPERHLMATLIDSVRQGNYLQAKLHGNPKWAKRLKPPALIERPGVEQPKSNVIRFGGRHGSNAKELAQLFGSGAQAS